MPGQRPIAIILGLSLAAIGIGAGAATATQSLSVNIAENNDGAMVITTSTDTLHAGQTTFNVTNKSSSIEHEFLISRIEAAPGKLPYDEAAATLKESAMKDVTELGDLAAGGNGTMTLDLKPGKYMLFCNLPGHFKAGMYHLLTVTQ